MSSKIFELIEKESARQRDGLMMIPSENYASENVLKALGSVLANKYSEGYPGARYYSGNQFIDEIESYTKELANKLFKTKHANVQPYSGSPANLAVDLALLNIGDTLMGMSLSSGGHLTHGASASFTSKLFNSIQYGVKEDGQIDYEEVERLAIDHKPKVIWCGGTAYPFILDFKRFSEIADKINAYLVTDISHISGLILGGVHPDPSQYVDVITTTTHKTLRGPRGAMILITERGLNKDVELGEKIDKSIFPGLQGGPHDNQVAALSIALEEAEAPSFSEYASQIVKNAKVLANKLNCQTENHLLLWDLSEYGFGLGYQMSLALEAAGIYVNRNSVPGEKSSPFHPSGIRLGTPALTTRGMKESDMEQIGDWILEVLEEVKGSDLPKEQSERREFIKNFKNKINENQKIKEIRNKVQEFASRFPMPGVEK